MLTLENNSDSIFEFNVDDTIHSVEPKPNSLVLVKPSSIYHRVSPLEKGERTILKFILILFESIFSFTLALIDSYCSLTVIISIF